jgi:predicted hydrocarbon binding protein
VPIEADLTIVNAQLRLTLMAMRQVLGDKPFNEILEKVNLKYRGDQLPEDDLQPAIGAADYSKLMESIEKTYRSGAGRIQQRIGKAYFQAILREQPAAIGIARTILYFWSEERRVRLLLESLVDMLRKLNPQSDLRVDQEHHKFTVIDHNCSICQGRNNQEPVCNFTVGMIEEAVDWATEKEYEVIETDCMAKGDSFCRFSITRV